MRVRVSLGRSAGADGESSFDFAGTFFFSAVFGAAISGGSGSKKKLEIRGVLEEERIETTGTLAAVTGSSIICVGTAATALG